MKKYLFFAAAIAATLASCSSDADDAPAVDNGKQTFFLSSQPFEFDDDIATRVTLTLNEEKGIQFAWDNNEKLGVYPIKPLNTQALWKLKATGRSLNEDGTLTNRNYAEFDGAGWGLRYDVKYAAYHPYNGEMPSNTPPTAIPVSMKPNQDGTLTQGGTLNYIGKNIDFMCATQDGWYDDLDKNYPDFKDPVEPGDPHDQYGPIVFDFFHAISIIQIKVPAAVTSLTVTSLSGNNFITEGTWNIVTSNTVTGTNFTDKISLLTPDEIKDGKAIFYLATFPTTTGECIINTGDASYQVASKTLRACCAYRWSVGD